MRFLLLLLLLDFAGILKNIYPSYIEESTAKRYKETILTHEETIAQLKDYLHASI